MHYIWIYIFSTLTLLVCILTLPTELGIEAVKIWVEKYLNLLHDRFPQEFAIQDLKLVLENNTLNFGNSHFIQTKGTAIGTKVAPTYATLTLGYLEYKLH